jgi:hypothetical protein
MSHFPKKTKKKTKNDQFPPPHARGLRERFGERFFPLGALRERPGSECSLPGRSLKNQGAQFLMRERALAP